MPEISKELALALLKESNARTGGGRTKVDPTTKRDYQTWFKLSHHINETGCENPDCQDPRKKKEGKNTGVVADVHGTMICRFCFLDGYLL